MNNTVNMSFKNILVPFDFETLSNLALDNAIKIAKFVKDSKITILHVVEELVIPPTVEAFGRQLYSFKTGEVVTGSVYVKELYHEMRSSALKKLEKKKQKCEKAGISCQIIVILGIPKEQIVKYVREQKIDLVVMGTVKRKGISKIMTLGSVARSVSENASCPVMLVH
ncbi:MAG: hypothetical protein DA328_04540 [Nitrososphaeraceae archaeon]|nr:hypothetical protein [Nitrososphaeraceae archaeon]